MPKTKQFDEIVVLDKARDVFWKKGYNGTSIDDLVQATGLSRSSIYDSFGDKHGLYIKALKQYQQSQRQMMLEGMPANLTAKKKITWLFQNNIAESLGDRQRKGCFILNTTTELANVDSSLNSFVNTHLEAMEELLLTLIREGQAAGDIGKKFTARALARNLFSSLNGLKIIGQTRPHKQILEDIAKVALSVLD
ncbi:MAG TPA: TetR/AcrR family transcriptional regulator [Chitinophagaceae bacterium]|nr:TetR/AcrR family transcriptional regulator [Chitinophagaceae bacterium]